VKALIITTPRGRKLYVILFIIIIKEEKKPYPRIAKPSRDTGYRLSGLFF